MGGEVGRNPHQPPVDKVVDKVVAQPRRLDSFPPPYNLETRKVGADGYLSTGLSTYPQVFPHIHRRFVHRFFHRFIHRLSTALLSTGLST